jgi:serine/threonine protein kinase
MATTTNYDAQQSCYSHSTESISRKTCDLIHEDVRDVVATSRLERRDRAMILAQRSQIRVEDFLGKGAFSEVHQVTVYDDKTGKHKQLAMKHLKHKLLSQPANFRLAAAELAIEAHMLASFDHQNIIQIHGWAANGVASFVNGRHDSFFLLLDCLDETLESRIKDWGDQQHPLNLIQQQYQEPQEFGLVQDIWKRFTQASQPVIGNECVDQEVHLLYLEKLGICAEIASALAYLHQQGVIFRDLKPNNIGFQNSRVKLFDFGLSRELPSPNLITPFEMSGKVGTLRYMSPEVALHQPYNVASDVYSWSMVAYEVLTLRKPFAGWTRDMHTNLVCHRGARPHLQFVLQHAPKVLLEQCWNPHSSLRPTMKQVEEQMTEFEQKELLTMSAQPHVALELPQDFGVVRKAPVRNASNNTGLTASMSNSLNAMFT